MINHRIRIERRAGSGGKTDEAEEVHGEGEEEQKKKEREEEEEERRT